MRDEKAFQVPARKRGQHAILFRSRLQRARRVFEEASSPNATPASISVIRPPTGSPCRQMHPACDDDVQRPSSPSSKMISPLRKRRSCEDRRRRSSRRDSVENSASWRACPTVFRCGPGRSSAFVLDSGRKTPRGSRGRPSAVRRRRLERSMIAAIPWPTDAHRDEASGPRTLGSCIALTVRIAPVAPIGWPRRLRRHWG